MNAAYPLWAIAVVIGPFADPANSSFHRLTLLVWKRGDALHCLRVATLVGDLVETLENAVSR